MNTVKSFVKQFLAAVKGDTDEAAAQKALRQANSALSTQISILEGDLVNKEDAVASTKEALEKAVVNGGAAITNRDSYVENLFYSKNRVTEAEEALKKHQAKIEFLKEQQAGLDKDSEA